ncbi:MAG TPA: MFS transporter [Acetobacteraceae bacterium]|nr:MFS transporter [Acetobacteraceae bacterium]
MGQTIARARLGTGQTAFTILGAISLCHLLNDTMQTLLPALYPLFRSGLRLSFVQLGVLTLAFQVTGSLLQPFVGRFTDRRPQPYSLPVGMSFTMAGILILAMVNSYSLLLLGAALIGIGSSIFHPESSRLARIASGGRFGLAQSVFQVGGNLGQSLAPLVVAFFILPRGRGSLAWVAFLALFGIALLSTLGRWYQMSGQARPRGVSALHLDSPLPQPMVRRALAVLIALVFSKFFYLASITNFYIFYLMEHFHLTTASAQICLFAFLAAVAAGTLVGGPLGDQIGRKYVIWGSILGVLPFTLVLPYVGLGATIALSIVIGLVLSSAFSSIVVYGTELMPGRVGAISGLFFGLAFGIAGLGAAVLGAIADWTSIEFVYRLCAFLPAIGLLAILLPDVGREGRALRAARA